MAEIYEISRRQFYVLIAVAILLSVLLVMLGFVLGRNIILPDRFPTTDELTSNISKDGTVSEEIKNLRQSTKDDSSKDPFVEDEGLSFYTKLNIESDADSATDKTITIEKSFSEAEKERKDNRRKPSVSDVPLATPSPTPNPFATAKADFKKAYIVQVSSVKKKVYADETLKKLLKLNYPAYISKIRFNTGIVNFRVRVGPYTERSAANKIGEQIRKQLHLSPLVMTVKNGER
ncbi:SPOR domain-containing protein [bacterium]|nr:SPOR domain-containing protein [bacterium]